MVIGVVCAAAADREQLPAGVTPIHYDLALVPDAAHLTFGGTVQITLDVKTPTPAIVLNSDELVLDKVLLDKQGAAGSVILDTKLQRATLTFARAVAAGWHTLAIDYHGVIGTSTLGFFAMDYDSPTGRQRDARHEFRASVGARRLMPSWDEPGLKATFSITVDTPTDRMAVSNMPVVSTETIARRIEACVHFAVTPENVDLPSVSGDRRF